MQTLKGGLKKLKVESVETKITQFLFAYRMTPHSNTDVSSAEQTFGGCMCSPMDSLHPELDRKMRHGQEQLKGVHD